LGRPISHRAIDRCSGRGGHAGRASMSGDRGTASPGCLPVSMPSPPRRSAGSGLRVQRSRSAKIF